MKTARFHPGQKVYAFCKLGLQREEQWNRMDVEAVAKGRVTVSLGEQKRTLPYRKVKDHRQVDHNAAIAALTEQGFAKLVGYLVRGIQKLWPWLDMEVDEDEKVIYLSKKSVSVQPEIRQMETSTSFEEYATWGVSSWHHVSATQHEPADIKECCHGDSPIESNAAAIALNACWALHSVAFWEMIGEEEMFAQMEADKAQEQEALVESD